jgi:hypothetical protein
LVFLHVCLYLEFGLGFKFESAPVNLKALFRVGLGLDGLQEGERTRNLPLAN